MNCSYVKTPIGVIEIQDDDEQIYLVSFAGNHEESEVLSYLSKQFKLQFEEYFLGTRTCFDLPFLISGTPFQKAVSIEMSRIPYGETISYSQLAKRAGYPNAQRAVGTACKTNPLPFILPCHRVIKQDGRIGYYGGGEPLKELLIKLEKRGK